MAATVTIDESNGAGETVTANITNSNMGSNDSANLNTTTYPIVAGENSFEKWQRFNCTNLGGSSAITNFKVWRTTALSGSDTHLTNARTTSYAGAATYTTPTASASSVATQTMPTSEPASANLGYGGTLGANQTTTGYSDYLVHQIQTNAATTAGASCTMNYQYDEIA